jgi:hypothetical protein
MMECMVKDSYHDSLSLEKALLVEKEVCIHWKKKLIAARNITFFKESGYIVFLGLIIS